MIKVYDNGGKTLDRYLIILDNNVYGMSENPSSPQGFNQFCGTLDVIKIEYNESVGKLVKLDSLPDEVKKAIKERQRKE